MYLSPAVERLLTYGKRRALDAYAAPQRHRQGYELAVEPTPIDKLPSLCGRKNPYFRPSIYERA